MDLNENKVLYVITKNKEIKWHFRKKYRYTTQKIFSFMSCIIFKGANQSLITWNIFPVKKNG